MIVEDKVTLDGVEYVVAQRFGPKRVAIIYQGTPCMLDRIDHVWKISQEPVSKDENRALNIFRIQG